MLTAGDLHISPYGQRTLADLSRSLFSALGVAGFDNPLGIAPLAHVCLLVIDGRGWEQLQDHPGKAPFLTEAARGFSPLHTGFPSTTSASLASIGTGLPPGEHGIVGFAMAVTGQERPMNTLTWQPEPPGPAIDLRQSVVPEQLQPRPTAFERASAAGLGVFLVGPEAVAGSGLTRAALRGGQYRPAIGLGDLAAEAGAALRSKPRSFVYAYHADLDTTGHRRGIASEAWRLQLGHIDHLAASLAERVPQAAALVVTADHGMVDLRADQRIDLDDEPDLAKGVRFLGGEARARYLYTQPGAEVAVLNRWRQRLGERMWILSRNEALATGWFGPRVDGSFGQRIGDVVAVARGNTGIVWRSTNPRQADSAGHHGSVTAAEQLVPFIVVRT